MFAAITVAVMLVYKLGAPFPVWVDSALLLISLVATGIPHGAIDHVIYDARQSNTLPASTRYRRFLLAYLLLVGATFLVWLLVPELMFWSFLLVAAYHFGQSQLFYLNVSASSLIRGGVYLLWGILLLSALWITHWESQIPNLTSLFGWNLSLQGPLHRIIEQVFIATLLAVPALILFLLIQQKITVRTAATELVVLALLLTLINTVPLYTAFAVYFGIWHAVRVMITEYQYLNAGVHMQLTVRSFLKKFIPFSLLSIAGLAVLVLASFWLKATISPFMLFLVFISALTMPHAFVMEKMYDGISRFRSRIHTALSA